MFCLGNARQLVLDLGVGRGPGSREWFHILTFSALPLFSAPACSYTYHLQIWSLPGPLLAQLAPSPAAIPWVVSLALLQLWLLFVYCFRKFVEVSHPLISPSLIFFAVMVSYLILFLHIQISKIDICALKVQAKANAFKNSCFAFSIQAENGNY